MRSVDEWAMVTVLEIIGAGAPAKKCRAAAALADEHYILSDEKCACGDAFPCAAISEARETK